MSTQAKTEFSWWIFFTSIIGVTMVRYFLECFSDPSMQASDLYDLTKFFHYAFFYFSLFLSFTILVYVLTKKPLFSIMQDFLPFSLLILIPPIVDLFLSKGLGKEIVYFFLSGKELFRNFYSFGFLYSGITFGLKITAAIIIVLITAYVFKKTNRALLALICALLSYLIIFFYASFPNLLLFLTGADFSNSIAGIFKHVLADSHYFNRGQEEINILIEKFSAIIFWLTTVIQAAFLFYLSKKKDFSSWGKNLQWTRSFYWLFIAIVGIKIAHPKNILTTIPNLFDATLIILFLFVSLAGVWLAITINDLSDEKIDTISNDNRPLVSGIIQKKDYQKITVILAIVFLSGLWLLSSATAFLLLLGEMLYFFYSSPPFRLKRNFVTSSLVTGFAGLTVSMAGFFLFNPDQRMKDFPIVFLLFLPLVFAFLSNIKDLKDYAGDLAEKIKTIPVLFGQKKGARVIGISYVAVFMITPFVLQKYFLSFPMFMLAALAYLVITKNPFQEKFIFPIIYVYFFLMIVFI